MDSFELAREIESKMRARQECRTEAAADAVTHEIGLLVCGNPETILSALSTPVEVIANRASVEGGVRVDTTVEGDGFDCVSVKGHKLDSAHGKCVRCNAAAIDLYEDAAYGPVRACTHPPASEEVEAMVERLLAQVDSGRRTIGGAMLSTDGKFKSWGGEVIMVLRNPDGPAAAALIEHLSSTIEQAREDALAEAGKVAEDAAVNAFGPTTRSGVCEEIVLAIRALGKGADNG